MIKKSIISVFLIVVLISLVSAETLKIEFPNGDEFGADEQISLKISLLDSENKPINQEITLTFEDSLKNQITKQAETNKVVILDLGKNKLNGFWKATATYNNLQETVIFSIKEKEQVKFELGGDVLKITNTGNTPYSKTIQIAIGNSIGQKEIELGIGESASFRLIAPDGTYNVKISDGVTSLTKGDVSLIGEAIGILDDRENRRVPITGINPDNPDSAITNKSKFVYVFVIAIIGATILLSIERRYRKKAQ